MKVNGAAGMTKQVRPEFYVRVFSQLEISDGSITVSQEMFRSDMVVKLIAYLVLHRERSCTITEITEALWPEDASANPAGALKNLAYRLRTILKKFWPGVEFVVTGKGSYTWNPELVTKVDIDDMKACWQAMKEAFDPEERIRLNFMAIRLYRGKLLADYCSDHWIMPRTAYYENQYTEMVKTLAGDLEAMERFPEMEDVCLQAITLEPLDEKLHVLLIRAYLSENKTEEAENHYRLTEKLLYDNMGVGPSEELRTLFASMMNRDHKQELDIGVIQFDLREEAKDKGAFFCSYAVFKKVYELEARRVRRLGMTVYIALLTIYTDDKKQSQMSDYLEVMEKASVQIRKVVQASLRSGDVFCRYSLNQFLIMLPYRPYENAKRVMERIFKGYEKVPRRAKVRLQYSLKEMDLDQEECKEQVENTRMMSIRVAIEEMDSDKRDFSGEISSAALGKIYRFHGVSDFMVTVDRMLDQIGQPQASQLRRSFDGDLQPSAIPPVSGAASPDEEEKTLKGAVTTVNLDIRSRYHSTWQGVLFNEAGKQVSTFSSALELISLIVQIQKTKKNV